MATCWESINIFALLYGMVLVLLSFSHMLTWVKCGTPDLCFLSYFGINGDFESGIEMPYPRKT